RARAVVARLPLGVLPLFAVVDRMEARRLEHVVPARKPIERKSPSDRGVCGRSRTRGAGRRPGGLSLRTAGARTRATGGHERRSVARPRREPSRTLVSGGALLCPLEGGVEVWRARVPVLPARRRARARGPSTGRRRAWLATSAA